MEPITVTYLESTQMLNWSSENTTDIITNYDVTTKCILAILMTIFIGLSIIGNVSVIVVVSRQRGMFTRTNLFLCNLAVADLLAGITLMPVSLITIIAEKWIFNDIMCQLNGFLAGFLLTYSVHTLMYIAVHKYTNITQPLKMVITRKKVYIMIAATWIWAALAGYIRVHGLGTVGYKPYHTQCAPDYPSDTLSYLSVVFVAVFVYLIPFMVMLCCYVRIFKEIKSYSARLSECTNQTQEEVYRHQWRSSLTLCIILIVFLLCFSPYIGYCIYVSLVKDKKVIPKYLNAFVYWLGYMNSAVNPVIYGLRISGFRRGYSDMVIKLQCRDMPKLSGKESHEHKNIIVTAKHPKLRRLQTIQWLSESNITTSISSPDRTTPNDPHNSGCLSQI